MNALFCYYCQQFPPHSTIQMKKYVLITVGYSHWKIISNMTKRHDNTMLYRTTLAKYGARRSIKK